MTAQLYATGAASCLALVVAVALAAVRIRARVLPPLTPASARLCELILGLGLVIVVSEALGSVGLFERAPLLIGCWVVTAAVFTATRKAAPAATLRPPRSPRLGGAAAAIGVGMVLFAFGVGTFSAWHGANWDIDSVGYHLPESARFFQSHWLTHPQFTSADPAPAYYPANSELLHAVGMVLFNRDVLTIWINLGFAALGLLAAWCLGDVLGYPPATLLAVAVLECAPSIAQGGNALNDGVGLDLATAAVALGLSARGGRVRAVGALAAGLALGTKLNLLVPMACLMLAAIVLARHGRRVRVTLSWITGVLAGGGFWFARNLASTGSPLPLLKLGPLPHVTLLPGESTNLVQGLHAGTLTAHQMTSALSAALGRAWPVLLACAAAGLLWAAWRGAAAQRACGLVGLAALASFAFTPLTGSHFDWTVRYAVAPLALGLALLATMPTRSRPAWGTRWAPLGLLALAAVTLRPPPGNHAGALLLAVVAAVPVAIALRAIPWPRLPGYGWLRGAVACGTVAALLVAGYPVARGYLRHRFTALPGGGPLAGALLQLARFGQSVQHKRIGIVGPELQYHFVGPSLSNYVQYVGVPGAHGNWNQTTTCALWRRFVNAGHYNYVVTTPPFWPTVNAGDSSGLPVPTAGWTAGDPAARQILHPYPTVSVFELRGPLQGDGCAVAVAARHYHRQ